MKTLLIVVATLALAACEAPMCSRFLPGDRVQLKGTGVFGEVRFVDCRTFTCKVSFKPDALADTKYLVAVDQVVLEPVEKK